MKKILLYSALVLLPNLYFAQNAKETNNDVVLPYHLKQSEWEKLTARNDFRIYFRISSIGNYDFMDVRIVRLDNKDMNIKNGQTLTFDLLGDEPVVLSNPTETTSCIGCGALALTESRFPGIDVSYIINKADIAKLRTNIIFKVLIATNEGTLAGTMPAASNNYVQKAITTTQ